MSSGQTDRWVESGADSFEETVDSLPTPNSNGSPHSVLVQREENDLNITPIKLKSNKNRQFITTERLAPRLEIYQ
ncbi:hypothetical protein J6590_091985 [Homalodisca vitripennis]|nr:hypothetical protein J6590_091985 [Homalodisca vitripennis]